MFSRRSPRLPFLLFHETFRKTQTNRRHVVDEIIEKVRQNVYSEIDRVFRLQSFQYRTTCANIFMQNALTRIKHEPLNVLSSDVLSILSKISVVGSTP